MGYFRLPAGDFTDKTGKIAVSTSRQIADAGPPAIPAIVNPATLDRSFFVNYMSMDADPAIIRTDENKATGNLFKTYQTEHGFVFGTNPKVEIPSIDDILLMLCSHCRSAPEVTIRGDVAIWEFLWPYLSTSNYTAPGAYFSMGGRDGDNLQWMNFVGCHANSIKFDQGANIGDCLTAEYGIIGTGKNVISPTTAFISGVKDATTITIGNDDPTPRGTDDVNCIHRVMQASDDYDVDQDPETCNYCIPLAFENIDGKVITLSSAISADAWIMVVYNADQDFADDLDSSEAESPENALYLKDLTSLLIGAQIEDGVPVAGTGEQWAYGGDFNEQFGGFSLSLNNQVKLYPDPGNKSDCADYMRFGRPLLSLSLQGWILDAIWRAMNSKNMSRSFYAKYESDVLIDGSTPYGMEIILSNTSLSRPVKSMKDNRLMQQMTMAPMFKQGQMPARITITTGVTTMLGYPEPA
jgi:hypothetical protein